MGQPAPEYGKHKLSRYHQQHRPELWEEMLQQPDAFGVHAGGRQVDHFGDAILAVGAGGFDVGQIHVGANVDAQRVGDAVHHLTDAETSRSGGEIKHADTHDHTGFRGDARFRDGLIPVAFDVLHVQRNGVGVVFADGLGPFGLDAALRFFFLFAHVSFSTPLPEPSCPRICAENGRRNTNGGFDEVDYASQ